MKVGYARVSTARQGASLEQQSTTLKSQGCEKLFTDVTSGARSSRPGLDQAMAFLREGDTLAVTRIDRLGRSSADTLTTIKELAQRGVTVLALDVGLDTSTAGGRLFVEIATVLASWERDLIVERTQEGLAKARAEGRAGGRPQKLSTEATQAVEAALAAGMSVKQVARLHGVSRWTIQRRRKTD